jgi:hypothetical protein
MTNFMKRSFFSLFLVLLFFSCSQNSKETRKENSSKKEVLNAAINYAKGKFKESKETVAPDGVVTITDNQVNFVTVKQYQSRYIIDPNKITIGLINDDKDEDAIINVILITGQNTETPENLIYIKTDGKFMLNRVIESNMKVLGIKDGIITAEVSSRSLNNPLRDCHVCKEVVKYKFQSGDLVKVN